MNVTEPVRDTCLAFYAANADISEIGVITQKYLIEKGTVTFASPLYVTWAFSPSKI